MDLHHVRWDGGAEFVLLLFRLEQLFLKLLVFDGGVVLGASLAERDESVLDVHFNLGGTLDGGEFGLTEGEFVDGLIG